MLIRAPKTVNFQLICGYFIISGYSWAISLICTYFIIPLISSYSIHYELIPSSHIILWSSNYFIKNPQYLDQSTEY